MRDDRTKELWGLGTEEAMSDKKREQEQPKISEHSPRPGPLRRHEGRWDDTPLRNEGRKPGATVKISSLNLKERLERWLYA